VQQLLEMVLQFVGGLGHGGCLNACRGPSGCTRTLLSPKQRILRNALRPPLPAPMVSAFELIVLCSLRGKSQVSFGSVVI
jgi:hypothetical protein